MNKIFALINDENILLKIKKKSEASFWEYQILGLLYYFFNLGHDYLIITDKRVLLVIKNDLIKNVDYKLFSSLKFNSNNNNLYVINRQNRKQIINLNRFRPSYEEIQDIKNLLKHQNS
ncbi:hypothetical protein [Winogradskyella sp. 4-2091]|uniref:hypothetical protein n=1 Tax=Winogradskyella sp. 4-2091 TaxID=3381659 RepID=UPI003891F986